MKIMVLIFVFIIALAVAGFILLFIKSKDKNITELAIAIQAVATVILVIVTGLYVNEVRVSRISQEKGFDKYVAELQESRKQQVKPYVYVFFYWNDNLHKFFAILKNVGLGPAFDVEYSYSGVNADGKPISHRDVCAVLPAGEETADMTPFATEHVALNNNVKVEISYKDSFGKKFTDTFEHSLGKLRDNPPPSKFAEFRRRLETSFHQSEINGWIRTFYDTFQKLQKDVSEIKEKVGSKSK